jgi:hypothetical protein
MRQQFLAREIEKAGECGAETASVLHVAPAQNLGFRRVTSPDLTHLGDAATAVWQRLVRPAGRFASVGTGALFGALNQRALPASMHGWLGYITARYRGVLAVTA